MSENLTENLTENPIDNLTGNPTENPTENLNEHLTENLNGHLTENLNGHLTEGSTEDLHGDSIGGLAGDFIENSASILNNNSVKVSTAGSIHSPINVNDQIRNSIGMEFVLIPSGEFDMGSPSREKRRKLWESPVHRVTIKKPFYMGRYPVTQEQWSKVVGINPSYFRGEKHPVEAVSWEEAQVFIRKLNALENNSEKNSVYRLPTEAEWEYVARAGTSTSSFFGDDESKLTEYAWFLKNSGLETHPVGLKKPNPWGLYDIYGNVGEWVQDEYHISYKGAPSDGRAWENPFSNVSVPVRIRRGGGWNGSAGCCRSAERLFAAQDRRLNSLGFRVVREL
ncbi:formylglycine-generating enzyme family protein [Methanosarcina sp.]|uniref:formylglycine-generating enzyme family protein n=1 Tax=Methanosarcina sp. TaxID=2213 RepID=UPI002ABA23FA|nr:SUMF1/EgtB/PvdO family nonheme iron enzyme [Methanosarcina sp.]MDY9926773.1 SUMF1/EgtB/PvdO family nonheme iron enzyme [Methanosarcina sp.]